MRKVFLVPLVLSMLLCSACGLIPISKEGLLDGEKVAVEIEGYAFYDRMLMTELAEGKTLFEVDRSSKIRSDNFAKETIGVIRERIPLALQERGVRVQTGAPIKVRVGVARGDKGMLIIFLGNAMIKGKTEYEAVALLGWGDPAGALFAPEGSRNLNVIKFAARKVSDLLANSIIKTLREKGELVGAK